jgi:hypothetical protein
VGNYRKTFELLCLINSVEFLQILQGMQVLFDKMEQKPPNQPLMGAEVSLSRTLAWFLPEESRTIRPVRLLLAQTIDPP